MKREYYNMRYSTIQYEVNANSFSMCHPLTFEVVNVNEHSGVSLGKGKIN